MPTATGRAGPRGTVTLAPSHTLPDERPPPRYWGGWDGISDDARGLIRALLDPDPDARLAADQALRHAWFAPAALRGDDLGSIDEEGEGIAEPGGLDGYEHLAEEEEEEGRLEVRPTKKLRPFRERLGRRVRECGEEFVEGYLLVIVFVVAAFICGPFFYLFNLYQNARRSARKSARRRARAGERRTEDAADASRRTSARDAIDPRTAPAGATVDPEPGELRDAAARPREPFDLADEAELPEDEAEPTGPSGWVLRQVKNRDDFWVRRWLVLDHHVLCSLKGDPAESAARVVNARAAARSFAPRLAARPPIIGSTCARRARSRSSTAVTCVVSNHSFGGGTKLRNSRSRSNRSRFG